MVPHVATFHGAPSGESSVVVCILISMEFTLYAYEFVLLILRRPTDHVFRLAPSRRLRTPCPVCFPSAPDPKPATGHQLRSESAGQRGSTGPRDLLEGCGDCCQLKRQPPPPRPPAPRASERIWCTTDEILPVANRRRTNPHPSRRSWFDERGGRMAVAFTHW